MADIDLSFGSDLGPLLDNFQRLLKASGELGNEVKKTATTMQVESRKSALEVVKIEQAYKETSQVVAQINSLGLNQFTNSIQLQVQATEQSVQANEELQKSADELVAKLLGQGATMAQQASQIEIALNKEAQALEGLIAKRLLAANPTEEKALNLEIAKQVNTIETLKKKYDELNNTPGPDQQTEGFTRLQVQIREAEKEAQRLGEQYGTLDERFIAAAQKAANLKEELSDVKQAIDAQNPEAKFKAFESAVGGVTGSLQTATGALQLFGAENERVQEIAIRLQGLFNFVQGVNTILSLKDSFSNLLVVMGLTRSATIANTTATVAQGTAAAGTAAAIGAEAAATTAATTATNSLTAALLANPFTAMAVAVTALVGALLLLGRAGEDAAEAQKKLNDSLEKDIDTLEKYNQAIDTSAAKTAARSKVALEALKAQGAPLQEIQDLQIRIAKDEFEASKKQYESVLQRIGSYDALKTRISILQESLDKLKKTSDDKDLIEQRQKEIDLLQKYASEYDKLIVSVYNAKAAIIQLQDEVKQEDLKRQLENARGFIAARLEEAKKGSSAELKAKLDAIELEKKAQIDALGFNQDVEGQRLKIEAEANKKRLIAYNDYLKAQIEQKIAVDKIGLARSQENSREELELKIRLLEDERNLQLANLDLTEKEKLAIILESAKKESQLRRKFAQDEVDQAIQIEKSNAALRLALAEKNTVEEYQALRDLINSEQEKELQKVLNDTTISEELRQQEVLRIRAETNNKLQDLSKQYFQKELETEQTFIKIASDARLDALNRTIQAENTGAITRRSLQIQYYDEVIKQIDREKAANIDAFNNQLISYEEFLKKKAELDARYANAQADKQNVETQKRDIFDVLGIDLSNTEKQQASQAINSIFSNLKSGFDDYIQERQNQLDKIKAQNDDLIASINEGIAQTQEAIGQEIELAKLGYANNVDAKKKELEELKKQKLQALENDKKIAKEQQKLLREKAAADAIAQASSLAVAAAQVFAAESSKGIVGVLLAVSAITLLLSTFLRFKAQSSAASTQSLGEGGTLDFIMNGRRDSGTLFGKSHSHPSGGMRIEGTNIFVEGEEEVIRKRSARKFRKVLKAINNEDFSGLTYNDLRAIIAGSDMITPQQVTDDLRESRVEVQNHHTSTIINAQVEPLRKEMQATREEIKNLRRDNKKSSTERTVMPDGTVIEKMGNTTNIIRKA